MQGENRNAFSESACRGVIAIYDWGMNIVAGEEEYLPEELRPIYEPDELDELVSSRIFPKQF